MRKITLTLLVSTFLSLVTYSQIKVTVNVYSKLVKENESVFITGNHPELGEWIPDKVVLQRIDSSL